MPTDGKGDGEAVGEYQRMEAIGRAVGTILAAPPREEAAMREAYEEHAKDCGFQYPPAGLSLHEWGWQLWKTAAELSTPPKSGWRPEVRAFAKLMETQLRANDHKPGWKNNTPTSLHNRLLDEAVELQECLREGTRSTFERWALRVAAEAADVANFAMMIADVCGALPPTSPAREEGS